ncbi:MAG: PilZ domain-containing protein [Sphingobium sp.]
MQIQRSRERIAVDIPILVTTVLDNQEGVVVDLSEGGAQVVGCSLPPRTRCQLDLDGFVVFGTVQWSEIDRMGIRFLYELTDGPFFDRLEMARNAGRAPVSHPVRADAPSFAPALAGGFGRRSA